MFYLKFSFLTLWLPLITSTFCRHVKWILEFHQLPRENKRCNQIYAFTHWFYTTISLPYLFFALTHNLSSSVSTKTNWQSWQLRVKCCLHLYTLYTFTRFQLALDASIVLGTIFTVAKFFLLNAANSWVQTISCFIITIIVHLHLITLTQKNMITVRVRKSERQIER